MNILKIILIASIIPTGLQAFTIYNKSSLPATITQFVIQMRDGDSSYQSIEQVHTIVQPEQTLSFDRTSIVGLQLIFNNSVIALAFTQNSTHAYITLEKNNTITSAQNVTIVSQESVIPTAKTPSIGPRLA